MLKLLLKLVIFVFALIGIGAVAFLVLGNSDSDPGSTGGVAPAPTNSQGTPTGDLTADELLQLSTESAAKVTSFHFVLTHENGSTPLPLNLDLNTAEGDIQVPSSMKAEVKADEAGINVSVDIIGIDDRTWVTNPFTRQWQELPNVNIRDFADPAALVSGLLPSITDATFVDGGSVDGVGTYKVTGTIDSGALHAALGIAEAGHTVTVEVWIGKDDMLPRRVRLAGPLSGAESQDVVRQVELSRYNQPVEIMPPE